LIDQRATNENRKARVSTGLLGVAGRKDGQETHHHLVRDEKVGSDDGPKGRVREKNTASARTRKERGGKARDARRVNHMPLHAVVVPDAFAVNERKGQRRRSVQERKEKERT
jgi:hypothetical protein